MVAIRPNRDNGINFFTLSHSIRSAVSDEYRLERVKGFAYFDSPSEGISKNKHRGTLSPFGNLSGFAQDQIIKTVVTTARLILFAREDLLQFFAEVCNLSGGTEPIHMTIVLENSRKRSETEEVVTRIL